IVKSPEWSKAALQPAGRSRSSSFSKTPHGKAGGRTPDFVDSAGDFRNAFRLRVENLLISPNAVHLAVVCGDGGAGTVCQHLAIRKRSAVRAVTGAEVPVLDVRIGFSSKIFRKFVAAYDLPLIVLNESRA